jgi:hypothetical protein
MPKWAVLQPISPRKLHYPIIPSRQLIDFRAEQALEASRVGVVPPMRHRSAGISHLPIQLTATHPHRLDLKSQQISDNNDGNSSSSSKSNISDDNSKNSSKNDNKNKNSYSGSSSSSNTDSNSSDDGNATKIEPEMLLPPQLLPTAPTWPKMKTGPATLLPAPAQPLIKAKTRSATLLPAPQPLPTQLPAPALTWPLPVPTRSPLLMPVRAPT